MQPTVETEMSEFDMLENEVSTIRQEQLDEEQLVNRLVEFARARHVPFRGITNTQSPGDWGVRIRRIADNVYPFFVTPSIAIPPFEYRRKFDRDLQAAVSLTDAERRSMTLTAAKDTGERKIWRGVCSMFIMDGQIVRTNRQLTTLSATRVNDFLCRFSLEARKYPSWRATKANGQHLVKHSANCYSLTW